ncbi:MAG TPA: 4a-hydroxytetrahydrobiopterin dehydratase [Candidatus Paceibacterota bacterium]|nr:4a-hydroxytetrahydrobiopterin dehydratase [Candidatus Paceibacterota bacterium]
MSELSKKKCVPCEGDFPAFTKEQATDMMEHIPEWTLSDNGKAITRSFPFKDFKSALAFANKVGKVAEEEWHHPDLIVAWGRVEVLLTTHSIKGLAENDFIMAAKIDLLIDDHG